MGSGYLASYKRTTLKMVEAKVAVASRIEITRGVNYKMCQVEFEGSASVP